MEKEKAVTNKLEVIRERVEMQRTTADALGMEMGGQYDEMEYLLGIIDAASGMVGTLKGYAANIRHNNYDIRSDWEARAKAYDSASLELHHKMNTAVDA